MCVHKYACVCQCDVIKIHKQKSKKHITYFQVIYFVNISTFTFSINPEIKGRNVYNSSTYCYVKECTYYDYMNLKMNYK